MARHPRPPLLVAALVVVVLTGTALVDRAVHEPVRDEASASPPSAASPGPSAAGATGGAAAAAAGAPVVAPTAAVVTPPASAAPPPVAPPSASTPGASTEALPSTAAPSRPPAAPPTGRPAPTSPAGPLLSGPLPRGASSTTDLVAGWPVQVVAPVPGGRVLSTSVSPLDRRLQVALAGDVEQGPEAVIAFYRTALTGLGFRETPAPAAAGGTTAAGFDRGPDSLTVTVTPDGSTSAYAVLGTLTAGA